MRRNRRIQIGWLAVFGIVLGLEPAVCAGLCGEGEEPTESVLVSTAVKTGARGLDTELTLFDDNPIEEAYDENCCGDKWSASVEFRHFTSPHVASKGTLDQDEYTLIPATGPRTVHLLGR